MPSNFIEFFCECGMAIRVPKSQAGKTAECGHCFRTLQIPLTQTTGFYPAAQPVQKSPGYGQVPNQVMPPRQPISSQETITEQAGMPGSIPSFGQPQQQYGTPEMGYPQTTDPMGYAQAPGQMGYPQTPDSMGYPQAPGQMGYPQTPDSMGYPQAPGQMGYPQTPGQTGYPQTPGQTGYPQAPGQMGYPQAPGQMGYPQTPGQTGYPQTPDPMGYAQAPGQMEYAQPPDQMPVYDAQPLNEESAKLEMPSTNQPKKIALKPKKTGRAISFIFSLFFLAIGFGIGLLLCPGYLDIVPPGNTIFPQIFPSKQCKTEAWFGTVHENVQKLVSPQFKQRIDDDASKELDSLQKKLAGCIDAFKNAHKDMVSLVESGKNIETWQAKTSCKDAGILHQWNKSGKLDIHADEEIEKLKKKTDSLSQSASRLPENEAKEIVKLVSTIVSKIQNEQEKIQSAMADFRSWNP